MSQPADLEERKLSRRRFIKRAGAFAAVGAAAITLGDAVGRAQNLNIGKLGAPPVKPSTTPTSENGSGATARVIYPKLPSQPSSPAAMSMMPPSNSSNLMADSPFSIFWITDTQFLSESNPALFKMLNNWIVNNWEAFNGKIVIHTGDVVQDGNVAAEWANANDAMSVLTANKIPYTWCAGNHDDNVRNEASSGWMGNEYLSFNPAMAKNMVNQLPYTQWVGSCHDGMNTAMTFFANNMNFLVVNIEWNAQADVLQWVEEILDDPTYSNHRIIMAPHAYINAFGSTNDPGWGPMLSDFTKGLTSLLNQHSSNVFLTLNGHFATECGYNTSAPINNRNELMFDRQDCTDDPSNPLGRGIDSVDSSTMDGDKVGGATAMVLTFDTPSNRIEARTYDIYSGKWRENAFDKYKITMFPNLAHRAKNSIIAV